VLPGITGLELVEALEETGDFKWMLWTFAANRQPTAIEVEIEERNHRMMEGNGPNTLAKVMSLLEVVVVPDADYGHALKRPEFVEGVTTFLARHTLSRD